MRSVTYGDSGQTAVRFSVQKPTKGIDDVSSFFPEPQLMVPRGEEYVSPLASKKPKGLLNSVRIV